MAKIEAANQDHLEDMRVAYCQLKHERYKKLSRLDKLLSRTFDDCAPPREVRKSQTCVFHC